MTTPVRNERARRALRRLLELGCALPLAAALLWALVWKTTGETGILSLNASELALFVDYAGGETRTIYTPGYHLHWPWLERVYVFQKGSMELVLGKAGKDEALAPPVTVRANDGSTFWFEGLGIQYQLSPEKLPLLAEDLGLSGAAHRRWLSAAARAILAEEFGRRSSQDVTEVENLEAAKVESRERLAALFAPRGLDVLQIVAPKPRFVRDYERAIEERKLAAQEADVLRSDIEDAREQRTDLLLALERERSQGLVQLGGDSQARLHQAGEEQGKLQQDAQAFRLKRATEATAESAAMRAEAAALRARAEGRAQVLGAQVAMLEARGPIAVREELVRQLGRMTITLSPFSIDATPERVEHVDAPKGQ